MCKIAVTTLRVVWIEILYSLKFRRPLGSPPCGWCGLKSWNIPEPCIPLLVTTLRVVWIEIPSYSRSFYNGNTSPPCGWCGLKCLLANLRHWQMVSPPCGWCGLKWPYSITLCISYLVTTLRVVWIEILGKIAKWFADMSPPCGWCGLKSFRYSAKSEN